MDVSSSSAEEPKVVRPCRFALQPSNSFVVDEHLSAVSTFPKSVRLRKRADFVRLSVSIDKLVAKGFLVIWQVNDLLQPRLGVTVSKKVGCAVTRSRVKRYIREVFRHNRLLLPSVDMNVIARRESATMDFHSVLRELEKVFRQIGISPCSKVLRSL
jgi:ribonuclease P protein component